MSDLSDFKRIVHEPLEARCRELQSKLEAAERERDRLKNWQRAYSKGRAGLTESAAMDFARAEAAEQRLARLEEALRNIRDISGNHKPAQLLAAVVLAKETAHS